MGALERIFEMLEYEPKIRNDTGIPINIKTFIGNIEFKDIDFKYPSSGVKIIENLNLKIN